MPDRNITFEIKEHLGTIGKYESGWNKELNVISWNGATAKYDIRDWDEHHERMSRGVTLSQWEMRKMVDLYVTRNNERAVARGKAIEAERNARKDAAFKSRTAQPEMEELVAAADDERMDPADVPQVENGDVPETEVNFSEEARLTEDKTERKEETEEPF